MARRDAPEDPTLEDLYETVGVLIPVVSEGTPVDPFDGLPASVRSLRDSVLRLVLERIGRMATSDVIDQRYGVERKP